MTSDQVAEILEADQPPLVHIGYPKALSSWLQRMLFRPGNGFRQAMGPAQVKVTLKDPSPLRFDADSVREALQRVRGRQGSFAGTIPVVTFEGLIGNRIAGGYNAGPLADRLAHCFPTARVLVVIREQRSMLRSLYGHFVRSMGYPNSVAWLLDPVSPNMLPQTSPAFLHYDALVGYYRQRFGRDRVLALPYELFVEDPAAFVGRIAAFAGGPAQPVDTERLKVDMQENPGNGLTAVTAMRLVNKFLLKSPFDARGIVRSDRPWVRPWRIRATAKLDRVVPQSLDRWLEARFAAYVAERTAGQFRESNRRLAEMTGLDLARYGYEM